MDGIEEDLEPFDDEQPVEVIEAKSTVLAEVEPDEARNNGEAKVWVTRNLNTLPKSHSAP
ncbi:MAG: hypothetical protein F6K50_02920 [Moorea sp. SIO3I7]|nr:MULTISPECIES: hypothetical protein [unclassified Moorena]NEN94515.1 hypothetical protein [Moorena sp. SIO3I7]NEO09262.1 hypothetical protein [Moorena sp. SIO3I8]NEQ62052.1 hypothetical protein [Moorena sp. SIO4A1]